jgi:hypothetical protein
VKPENETVTRYWMSFYVNDGLCSLCGNRGAIDTRGKETMAGKVVGRLNWCICPNGQRLRQAMHPRQPGDVIDETAYSKT